MSLTQARLKELLSYNPDTGIIIRLKRTSMNQKVGQVVGYVSRRKYLCAMIDGKTYQLHWLAWMLHYGEFPKLEIDHINGNATDNRIANLRDVNRKTNMQNEVKARKNSTSGYLGVRWRKDRNKWIATIRVDGKAKKLGSFDNKEDAYQSYLKAKRIYHEGCTI